MRLFDLPVLWALTALSWLPPIAWKPPTATASASCECCVPAGRELRLLTIEDLSPPRGDAPNQKGKSHVG